MSEAVVAMMSRIGAAARAAASTLRETTSAAKDDAIRAAADAIEAGAATILATNAEEIAAASGLSPALVDRMTLTPARLAEISKSLRQIAALEDPVGKTIADWTRPNGLHFRRVRVPIGVVAVIYESRPNVTVDAAAISLKAGNATILRGGSECFRTSSLLARLFREGLAKAGIPVDALQFVETTDRAAVGAVLAGLDGAVDLVIPRGGKSLVARVRSEARVAVLSHLDGICHVYIDRDADIDKAVAVTVNAKMRRTGVCGAAETLLVDRERLSDLVAPVADALREAGCELRGDEAVRVVHPAILPATEDDWGTEYLAPIISVAAVDGVEGAIAHIARYGSAHTDAIVTENAETAARFLSSVDSAIVLHNASTQFADGGEFGFGAEIGIATGRLHARGPVGVEELTTYKTVVVGSGQIRI